MVDKCTKTVNAQCVDICPRQMEEGFTFLVDVIGHDADNLSLR